MHPAFIAAIALDTARERQRRGERLARLLPAAPPQRHGVVRRRLARTAATVARRLDEAAVLTDAPGTSNGA